MAPLWHTPRSYAAVVSPPNRVRTSPVMYDESIFDAKNTYAGATSSGCPGRDIGVSAPCFAAFFAGLSTTLSGVQIGPGETAFTRIFRSTRFWARDLVNAWMAPFVAE